MGSEMCIRDRGTATLGFTAEPVRLSCGEAVGWVEVTGERVLLVERVERKREFNHGAEGGLALFRGEVGIVHQVVGDGEKSQRVDTGLSRGGIECSGFHLYAEHTHVRPALVHVLVKVVEDIRAQDIAYVDVGLLLFGLIHQGLEELPRGGGGVATCLLYTSDAADE